MTERMWASDPAFREWFHDCWARLRQYGKAPEKKAEAWDRAGPADKPLRGGNYEYRPWRWDVK